MRAARACAALVVVAALAAGCDIVGPHECTTILKPGLVVWVRDSTTTATVLGPVQVVARAGAFADTARIFNPYGTDPAPRDFNPFQLAFERPGTYDVSIQAAGYRPWTKTGVQVGADECHVQTVTLTAALQRQ